MSSKHQNKHFLFVRINIIILCLILFPLSNCIEVTKGTGKIKSVEEQRNTINNTNTTNGEVYEVSAEEIKEQTLSSKDIRWRKNMLTRATNKFNENPNNLDNIIWYGRRLADLGRYIEAIKVFTDGLVKYPQSHRIFRHRGEQYIYLRNFDLAIDDLQNAAFYSSNVPNHVEKDGIPNKYNKPITNSKWNIYFHLGVAFYIKGNFDKSISSFKKCLDYSNNNDLDVRTSYWLYITYNKIGNKDAAESLIAVIKGRMHLLENKIYHDLIMLYKGFSTPDILIRKYTSKDEINAIVGYGLSNYYMLKGQTESAINILKQIKNSSQKFSYGYICAEIELNNIENTTKLAGE